MDFDYFWKELTPVITTGIIQIVSALIAAIIAFLGLKAVQWSAAKTREQEARTEIAKLAAVETKADFVVNAVEQAAASQAVWGTKPSSNEKKANAVNVLEKTVAADMQAMVEPAIEASVRTMNENCVDQRVTDLPR